MKQLVILTDVGGYTERLRALTDAHPHVIGITPHNLPCEGFTPIKVPDEWLSDDQSLSYSRKCWQASGTLSLSAICQLGLDADHYWIIESDCVASQERWKSLFESHSENETDGVFVCPKSRNESLWNPWWNQPGTPKWADVVHLNAIFRVSRRAVETHLSVISENKNCIGDMLIGSAIKRAGGTIGRINLDLSKPHHNNQTMKDNPEKVILNKKLINHPVKSNTYGFDI